MSLSLWVCVSVVILFDLKHLKQDAGKVFIGCAKDVSSVFQGCFKKVSRVFQESFKSV